MPKTVLHPFYADPSSLPTVAALVDRICSTTGAMPAVCVPGPAKRKQADPDQPAFNAQTDAPVKAGVQVTACISIAQQAGAETAFRARSLALDSETEAFPRFATDGTTVISF